ncbi:hypothetical protein Acr_00g0103280 [Actinidia rufa]|uniref:Rx N-terminal domain-containing protein n=1 Tax=Actinidia rufa TaxID=165716 RepID=A0A7J0E0M4_9ERIC|nr:hypothetical protein Acr_00g0103280 [Actinidia rufa]
MGLDDELKSLEGTLCMIKAVVLSADGSQDEADEKAPHLLNIWLKRLEDAFTTQIMFSTISLPSIAPSSVEEEQRLEHSIQGTRIPFTRSSTSLRVFRSRMGRNIRNITDRLHRIADDRVRFCVMMPEAGASLMMNKDLLACQP